MMLSQARRLTERLLIGESAPALVRWGKWCSPSLIRRIQREGFRDLVQYAATRQKFFAAKLRERGIDPAQVRKPEDLSDIYTAADDLLSLPPSAFLCREPQLVFETTGTSGSPKRVYFSYDELEFAARYEAAALYENGVRAGDRVACAFDAGYWISSWVTSTACKQLDVFCSAIGKPAPRDLYSRLGIYGYNVLIADPTWLVSLSEIAEKEGVFPLKVIFAAGDRMTDVYRNYVQQVWQAPVILGYGSTEAGGGLGMECKERQGYHFDEFNFLVEVLNPDSEGYGELVITTLSRRTQPLIRYRARDIARLIIDPCPCGTPLARISRIKGRRDEMVVMGAGNMHPEIFEKVLQDVPGLSTRWQVAVRQEGVHDVLEFRLELANGTPAERVEASIRRQLAERYPDVWSNYTCGMYQLAFRFLPAGSLEHGRKPRRLVDERTA
ncbi:MAG: phenylacetate--CoA ligase family protein [Terriglobia bacterium]